MEIKTAKSYGMVHGSEVCRCGLCCIIPKILQIEKPEMTACPVLEIINGQAICTVHGKKQPAVCRQYDCDGERDYWVWHMDQAVLSALAGQEKASSNVLAIASAGVLYHSPVVDSLKTTDISPKTLSALARVYEPKKAPLTPELVKTTGLEKLLKKQSVEDALRLIAIGQALRLEMGFLKNAWSGVSGLVHHGLRLNPNFEKACTLFMERGGTLPEEDIELVGRYKGRYTTIPDRSLVESLRREMQNGTRSAA